MWPMGLLFCVTGKYLPLLLRCLKIILKEAGVFEIIFHFNFPAQFLCESALRISINFGFQKNSSSIFLSVILLTLVISMSECFPSTRCFYLPSKHSHGWTVSDA